MAAESKEQFQSRALATTATNGAVPARYEAPVQGINTLAYEPTDLDQAFRMAQILVSSGLTPRGVDTPQKAFLIMAQGRELGLSTMQSLGNIYVVEGKVSLSSDLMAAMVLKSPVCEYLRCAEMTSERATYLAKRKGGAEFRYSFSWEDAVKAGLTNRPNYKANPADMLRHRALSKCVRAVFPDVVAGLYSRDEAEDIVDVTPRQSVVEVVQQATEAAKTPVVVEQTAKVRRRAPAVQIAAPVVESQPVAEEEADNETQDEVARRQRLDEAERAEYEEVAADRAREAAKNGPHRNEGGDVIDPISGEVLDGFDAGAFASVGDSWNEDSLTAAQKIVSDAKAMLSPSRYQSLAWLYFHARKAVLGKDAPSQYQQLRAI
jgi:hypothetical protein